MYVNSRPAPAPGRNFPPRILLMDDEAAILIPTSRFFGFLGCQVDTAEEAEEALALLCHRRYDLAILDLRLTRHNGSEGIDVLRELRTRNRWTSVIVLSACVSEEVEGELRRWQADAVLRKPQSLPELARIAFGLIGGGH
jgi:DNA-binding response OmpR family regulator